MELAVYEKEHLEILRKYLAECTVLLKKDGSFPVKEHGKVALFGSGVRRTIKGGTGSGEVNSRFFTNVEEGFEENGFTVTSKAWLDTYDEIYANARKEFAESIKKQIKGDGMGAIMGLMGKIMEEPEYDIPLEGDGDMAIYVLGRISGEGSDRTYTKGDILLTDREVRDILRLNVKYPKFMLVINAGGPVDLTPVNEVRNILVLSQLGVETGSALARIVLGDSPSGKLTTSWATQDNYPDVGDFGDMDDTCYREGIYVGYRGIEAMGKKAMYPFGYGLSFTEFSRQLKELRVDGTKLLVDVSVRNTGGLPGKETVLVYIGRPWTRLDHPVKELAGFAKTKLLEAGDEETVTVTVDTRDLVNYDEKNALYFLEKGRYTVYVGGDVDSARLEGAFVIPEEIVTRKVRNALGQPGFEDYRPAEKTVSFDGDTPVFDPECYTTQDIEYDRQIELDPRVKDLTDEELMKLGIGAYNEKRGLTSIVGNAGFAVAGAAGETRTLASRGIPGLVMADGPAGIRIAKEAAKDETGVYSLGNPFPDTMMEFIPDAIKAGLKLITKKPSKTAQVFNQYRTAIPIGTAIRQSFNTQFMEKCGDLVGDEMERFKVHLWLAPALNIHRDIRCGRNFEYYSEDPLVSGTVAAMITKGVQKHPGCGTTIKHFFANNQETNRTQSNSRISERACREIYLRGFELSIRESRPWALMTSYNLLNG
ncbi:MAG: glycoside hydrolase family 3 C-terminal domain-containing protein, partial [Oscillospiraceae bacterium]|nr:glycoside hydrolase family 3 C-terminal domain-containing protein [Oscillospiraceae bacterium]